MANSSRFYLKTFPAYGWIKKNYAILCIFWIMKYIVEEIARFLLS